MIKVHLHQIPAEGLHIEGEEDAECLGLKEVGVRALGPLRYALDVGLSEGGLFATGRLSLKVELKCVSTLEDFPWEIRVEDFGVQVELSGPEVVDLTPMIREDILLNLPPYPKKAVMEGKPLQERTENLPPPRKNKSGSPAWDVLNQLKIRK